MSSWAPVRSLWICSRSATVIVGSSSMRTSPALTLWPSRTRIARTTPVSNGWMTLVRPVGMILPGAEATMSMLPKQVQAKARQKRLMIVAPMARPVGDGGVSTISSAAGRNASSCLLRRRRASGRGTTFLADFMDATLQAVDRGIAPARPDQIVMAAVLDQPAAFNGNDAIGGAHGRQAMRNDEDRASLGDALHVLLNHPLAFIIEGARRLVEDQDARIHDERARYGDALALAAGKGGAALADNGVIALGQFQNEVVRAGKLGCGDDSLGHHRRIRQRNVVAHRAIEQNIFLQHDAYLPAQPRKVHHGEIGAVDENAPALGDVEALNQLGERAFA